VHRFHRVQGLERARPLASADVKYRDDRVELVPRRDAVVTLRDGEHVRRTVRAPDELKGPLARGERVGTVTVTAGGQPIRRVALVTSADVPGAGTLRVLLSVLGVPLTVLAVIAILLGAVLVGMRARVRLKLVRR
jgi:D-alanyl-D-alanine carboxypeptidase (penicillin-binding protein 5/6)